MERRPNLPARHLAALVAGLLPAVLLQVRQLGDRLEVELDMPGSILQTNGNPTGRTASWDMLAEGAPSTLGVSSTFARSSFPSWAVPAAAALVVVILVVVLILVGVSRRRQAALATGQPSMADQPWEPAGQPGSFFPAPPADLRVPDATFEPPGRPPVGSDPVSWAPEVAPFEAPVAYQPPSAAAVVDEPAVFQKPDLAHEPEVAEESEVRAVPGWYADPAGGSRTRYWDGLTWTQHTR